MIVLSLPASTEVPQLTDIQILIPSMLKSDANLLTKHIITLHYL